MHYPQCIRLIKVTAFLDFPLHLPFKEDLILHFTGRQFRAEFPLIKASM